MPRRNAEVGEVLGWRGEGGDCRSGFGGSAPGYGFRDGRKGNRAAPLTLGPLPLEQRTLLDTPAVWFMLGPGRKVVPRRGWRRRAAPAAELRPRARGSARRLRSRLPRSKANPKTTRGRWLRFLPRPPKQRRGEPGLPAPRAPGPPRQRGGRERPRTVRFGSVRFGLAPRGALSRSPASPSTPPPQRSHFSAVLFNPPSLPPAWEIALKAAKPSTCTRFFIFTFFFFSPNF